MASDISSQRIDHAAVRLERLLAIEEYVRAIVRTAEEGEADARERMEALQAQVSWSRAELRELQQAVDRLHREVTIRGAEVERLHREVAVRDAEIERLHREAAIGAFFDNGIRSNSILDQLYAELDPAARARFGDPQRTDGPDSFFAWATTPRREAGDLSRFLEAIYRRRPDVAGAFPDPGGRNRAAFLAWARTHGASELHFDSRLVPDDPIGRE